MYSGQTKLNMVLFAVIAAPLGANYFMDNVEREAMQKQLDEKSLLCIQLYKIESKHNYILECSGVLNK